MRSLIIGGGAIGQYLAVRLVQAQHETVILARDAQAQALNAQGISLHVGEKTATFQVRATAESHDSILKEPFELVIVAVKAYNTVEAAQTIGGISSCAGALLLTVQNGIGNEETLAEIFGADRIVAGALTVAVDRLDATSIAATAKGGLCIAPLAKNPHNWLIAAMSACGMPVRAVASWQALKWSKLCINILGNGVCAALDWEPSRVYTDRTAFAAERACLLEAVAVMSKVGLVPLNLINFPAALLVRSAQTLPAPVLRVVLANRVARGRGGKLPSLLMDLRAHRPQNEVTALNGAIALHALKSGLRAPANSRVAEIVSGVAAGTLNWDDYRGQPDKLLG
jgi:2-dehydropantoate 2-reductase